MYKETLLKVSTLLSLSFTITFISIYPTFSKEPLFLILENNKTILNFDPHNGAFLSIKDKIEQETISNSEKSVNNSPWELYLDFTDKSQILDIKDFTSFEYDRSVANTLVMIWSQAKDPLHKSMSIKATIKLEENNSLSSWHIDVTGLKGILLSKVIFPKVSGLVSSKNEYLALPRWMGELLKNPKKVLSAMPKTRQRFVWEYPGFLSMQFVALYSNEKGFYASSDDSETYRKNFSLSLDSLNTMVYQLENFPEIDSTKNNYSMRYNAILGTFKGDWFTAAEVYREWGEQQSWAKHSRFKNNLTPEWLQKTALWIWNRGRSEKVLTPAIALKKQLKLPISVLWHWWHGGSYDDSFPEYLPPREGQESFIKNVKRAKEKGINAIVYMNQLQWASSTNSWKKEGAAAYAVKNKQGNMNTHVYNIFTKKSLTNMCITTDFWKNKYTSLADSVINFYGVNGIYMDQACISRMCYDPSHGHTLGGGNYWVPNSGKLTAQIRSKIPEGKEIMLSGEGSGEAWMPYLDAFLALQVSRERYAGINRWEPIPLFQIVYHQYAITYGNYSSLLSPPYDEMWPEEHKPAEALTVLDSSFNKQFLMEQARSFVWGMQPMISNYKPLLRSERKREIKYLLNMVKVRNKSLKYLLYGRFVRSPHLIIPTRKIKISKLSIYAGQKDKVTTFEKEFPMIYNSFWLSEDKMLGIALTNIDDEQYPIDIAFRTEEYELSDSGTIYIINSKGKKILNTYSNGLIQIKYNLKPNEACVIEISPNIKERSL